MAVLPPSVISMELSSNMMLPPGSIIIKGILSSTLPTINAMHSGWLSNLFEKAVPGDGATASLRREFSLSCP